MREVRRGGIRPIPIRVCSFSSTWVSAIRRSRSQSDRLRPTHSSPTSRAIWCHKAAPQRREPGGRQGKTWVWHQRGQPLHELRRRHHQMRCAVAPGRFQLQHDLPRQRCTARDRWPAVRQRRAGDVAAQLLKAAIVTFAHAHRPVTAPVRPVGCRRRCPSADRRRATLEPCQFAPGRTGRCGRPLGDGLATGRCAGDLAAQRCGVGAIALRRRASAHRARRNPQFLTLPSPGASEPVPGRVPRSRAAKSPVTLVCSGPGDDVLS